MRKMGPCYFRNAPRDLISDTRNQRCELRRIIIVLQRNIISARNIRTVPFHLEVSIGLLDLIAYRFSNRNI
jgi:hypothetical protein